ncbi:thiamine diphosphokinase [Oceanobacillus polygoni]|uniref:Thiamine diphosphokinase n=2 Tax=Oceanobacillus polygoni TaxID=1235259 RepID=A0A9X0YUL8_9BACI|nr:thiamine diphosphokinase [Oceanobacillus polygoni]MBP2077600.1 thiamine pyrophosphokinase [Oceanobacillus polygoni]
MKVVAIVGNGPASLVPDLHLFKGEIDSWIGADRGAYLIAEKGIPVEYAVGDFDSIDEHERQVISRNVSYMEKHPTEKDETDMEIALNQAYAMEPSKIYLFGVTGGRLDHELINIQLLYTIQNKGIQAVIVDQSNQIEMLSPGTHTIENHRTYPYISFIPFTKEVEGIYLSGFHYPLSNTTISWGSTLCISNKLLSKKGTFSFDKGIVLLVKSCDTI